MRLGTFMLGPEAGGRGYKILAATGINNAGEWAGNVTLALLGWAKLGISTPFSGRFPVAGGAIMMRARYVEESTTGPVAYANGLYVPQTDLDRARNNERAIFGAIPLSGSFGSDPVDIPDDALASPVIRAWNGLGLAWRDRQIFAADAFDLDDMALKALESVVPVVQRQRIRGWCTTALLGSNGNFLPIRNCNLLVTPSSERLAHDRFVPCRIDTDGAFAGQMVTQPAAYLLWDRLKRELQPLLAEPSNAALGTGWTPGMAEWTSESIAWHLLETLSRHGESFATMIDVIAGIGDIAGDDIGADMVGRFLKAVGGQAPSVMTGLLKRFEERLANLPNSLHAVFRFQIWSHDDRFLDEADEEQLLQLVQAMSRDVGPRADNPQELELARRRVSLMEDRAVALAGSRHDFEVRGKIAVLRKRLGDLPGAGTGPPSRREAHRLLRLRTTLLLPTN